MVNILAYHREKVRSLTIPQLFMLRNSPDFADTLLWVDLVNPSEEEEETILINFFLFHALAVEDCQRERLDPSEGDHYPKVEDYNEFLYIIFNSVIIPTDAQKLLDEKHSVSVTNIEFITRQINAFLGKNFLVTHHYEPSRSIAYVRELCEKNPHTLGRGPDYIFHIIIDKMVDSYTPLMEYFDDVVDLLELRVFRNPQPSILSHILSLKKGIQRLRRIATYQREILNRLSRGEFKLVSQEEIFYYRNVYDHLVRISDLTETYRDVITGLLDVYLSVTSNRLNEIMKFLTMLSTIFLPLTLLTGIYGMNFDKMPELHWDYGYVYLWLALLSVAGTMLHFFHRKGWLK